MELTQNWKGSTTVLWLNPILTSVTSLGEQRVQLVVGPRINIAAPYGGKADLGWRAVIVLLFPN